MRSWKSQWLLNNARSTDVRQVVDAAERIVRELYEEVRDLYETPTIDQPQEDKVAGEE